MVGFDAVPGIRPTAWGAKLYAQGRLLVQRGITPETVLWDADEVLWDWVMSGGHLLAGSVKFAWGDVSHREWVAVRPGIIELLWGMRHEALALGLDPHVRIWTSGYAWRLKRIIREIPGFELLLGPAWAPPSTDKGVLTTHPRVFSRPDYVRVMSRLATVSPREVEGWETLNPEARTVIERELARGVGDSGLKLPELALLDGKTAFSRARILVDDVAANVKWFVAAGRDAVHVRSPTPRIFFGKIPNVAWRPERFLAGVASDVTASIAAALLQMAEGGHVGGSLVQAFPRREADRTQAIFAIDIPSDVLWREWIQPMRQLRKTLRSRNSAPSKWFVANSES